MSTFDYVLGISDFTAGTVTFTATPFQIARDGYRPEVGDLDADMVDENITVRVMGGSVTANLSNLRTVQGLLLQAARRQTNKTLDPVYLFFRESASGGTWRSELVGGKAQWEESALTRDYWLDNTQFANVEWTRRNYWEGAETQIALTNENGTANTSGLNVYNTNDGSGSSPNKRVNYVSFAGTAVTGELDALTRLEIKNTYASNLLYIAWVGQNYTDPANLTWFFDANAATGYSGTVASASGSGGNYAYYNLVSGTEATMFSWALTSANLDAFAGRMYKAMIRLISTFNTNVRYRLQLKWKNTAIWQSGLVSLVGAVYTTAIREIATLKMPPWNAGLTSQDPIALELRGYHTAGGTITVSLDHLQMIPVDGWRQIAYVGYGGTLNSRIIDDGVLDRLYADNGAGGSVVGNLTGYGQALTLRPGKDQRLYFQFAANTVNTAEIARVAQVKLYYRPRRRSL